MKRIQRMGAREWTLLVVLSVLWGGSFFFFKILIEAHIPTFTIVLGRVGLAALALLAFVHLTGRRMPTSPTVWLAFLVMGLLNNVVPFVFIIVGERQIASGLASIFNATTPLFTVVLSHYFAEDRITRSKAIGTLIGIGGVSVLIGPSALHAFDLANVAQLACLCAAFAYSCAGMYGRRFRDMGVDPIVTATGQVCGSTVLLLPLVALADRPWTLGLLAVGPLLALAGLAVLSTAVAYVIYFRLLSAVGATNLLLVTFLIPVSALFLGTLVLGERLMWTSFLGMALVFAGLATIDGRLLTAVTHRSHRHPDDGTANLNERAAYLAGGEGPLPR